MKFPYILFREISRKSLENFAKCEIKISRNISRNFVLRNFAGHPTWCTVSWSQGFRLYIFTFFSAAQTLHTVSFEATVHTVRLLYRSIIFYTVERLTLANRQEAASWETTVWENSMVSFVNGDMGSDTVSHNLVTKSLGFYNFIHLFESRAPFLN